MPRTWILCVIVLIARLWYFTFGDESEYVQSDVNGTDIAECRVEFRLDLPDKPEQQHKAPPRSPHHPQAPVLTVGVYQWVELQCTCCCNTAQVDQIKRAAARAAAFRASASSNQTLVYEEPTVAPGILQYHVISSNGHVIVPTERRKLNLNPRGHVALKNSGLIRTANCDRTKQCVELYTPIYCDLPVLEDTRNTSAVGGDSPGEQTVRTQGFYLYADNLGHSDIRVELIWVAQPTKPTSETDSEEEVSADLGDHGNQSGIGSRDPASSVRFGPPKPIHWPITHARIFVPDAQSLTNQTSGDRNETQLGRWEDHIAVTILLRPQKFYLAADWSAALIAFMIAVSVGCCNDPVLMRAYLRRPKSILLGLTCQLIVVPLVSLGIGSWFGLSEDEAYGLFVVATVPGGGLAYLFTYLVHGERHLSAALSLITSMLDIVTSALWTFGVGWFWFARPMQMGKAIGWLMLIAFGQAFGTVMRGCRPSVAHGILTWITRPLLLLAGILMVTLGVYINHYAFTEFNQNLLLSLLLLITCGFTLGWIAGQTTGQEIVVTRALATEAAVFNGLLCIPLLRTTVHAPEGDLAAIVAVWATFLVPIPLVYHGIVSVVHHWLTDYCQRRKKQQQEENGMSAIIANAAGAGTDLGAASVAAVAAAAIAVAPAIAAVGSKEARPRGLHLRTQNTEIHDGFVNDSDYNADPMLGSGRRRSDEPEQIPMTMHDPTMTVLDHPLITPGAMESDVVKHNPGSGGGGRLRNHVPGPVKPHKSQPHPPRAIHTEDHVLPYILSDYDPRSVGKQMAYAQQPPPVAHRHVDEIGHGHSTKPFHAHEKHKPPPYTNL